MNALLSAMSDENNKTVTTNGAAAFKSTKSTVLDFFAIGSALREQSPKVHVDVFSAAWNEDPALALKAMFYARDVRGGQGQREAFRNQLAWLASIAPETVHKNLYLIAEYGRWDDLYALVGTKMEPLMFELMGQQLAADLLDIDNASILAKWLKSENASSKTTKALALKTRTAFGLGSKEYRQTLSRLRKHLNVVEQQISAQNWDIDYERVPSLAMMKYRKAFAKHNEAGFTSYIEAVNNGEAKMNAGVLYPFDIIDKIGVFYGGTNIDPQVAQAMWDNLPDFIEGDDSSAIAVVDTSGSMNGDAINVAVSLGMYLAERSTGPFKDHCITFSDSPELIKIQGDNIVSKVRAFAHAPWGFSTNLEATFDLILNAAVANNIPQSEMVGKLFIISDMQFNCVRGGSNETLYQAMQRKFAAAGYEAPQVVFWNVRGTTRSQPVTMHETGAQLVSGFSPSIFKHVLGAAMTSPYELMLEVLNNGRYDALEV